MNCPICSTEMVKAKATNFGAEYDYCRTCKKELSEMPTDDRVLRKLQSASCAFGCDEIKGTVSSRCSIHGCGPLPECVICGARENETHGINCNGTFQSGKLAPCSGQTHKFSGKNPTPITVCNCGGRNWNGSWNPINPPGLNTMGVQSGRVSSKHPNAANGPKAISCGWCGLLSCSAQVWTDCASNMNPPPHRPFTRASLDRHDEIIIFDYSTSVMAEYSAHDAELTLKLLAKLKGFIEENDIYTIVGEKIFKPKK